jgi:glycosyltransferase involved in cell wall biosynthesis
MDNNDETSVFIKKFNKHKLHIGYFNFNLGWGGGENQIFNLVCLLHQLGLKVALVVIEDSVLLKKAELASLPVIPIKKSFSGADVLAACKKHGINFLHANDSKSVKTGSLVARKLGIPIVYSRRIASPIRKNYFSRRKYSLKNLDGVIAISNTVKDVFKECIVFPENRLFVVPSGIKVEEMESICIDKSLRDKYAPNSCLIGGLGKLSIKKNWQMLVKVADLCKKEGLDIRWIIAGKGPEKENLEKLIKEYDLSGFVHLIGFKDNSTEIIKSLDVLFFPSLIEGASVTVREAMILKTPVVAVNASGTAESLNGHGYVVAPDDLEASFEAIKELLTNINKKNKIINEAYCFAVKHFAFSQTILGTLGAYDNICEMKGIYEVRKYTN